MSRVQLAFPAPDLDASVAPFDHLGVEADSTETVRVATARLGEVGRGRQRRDGAGRCKQLRLARTAEDLYARPDA